MIFDELIKADLRPLLNLVFIFKELVLDHALGFDCLCSRACLFQNSLHSPAVDRDVTEPTSPVKLGGAVSYSVPAASWFGSFWSSFGLGKTYSLVRGSLSNVVRIV